MLDGKLVRHHVTQGQAEHMCADPNPAWCNTSTTARAIDGVVIGAHDGEEEPKPRWSTTMQMKRLAN
jgi:hypothetical protein